MNIRPKIKLILSPLDHTLELLAKLIFVVMWGLTIYALFKLPMTIPIHYNASGEADNYGNKMTLLILPFSGTLIYFGFTQLSKYPHIFNYPTPITEDNANRQYSIATRMVRFLKVALLLIFSSIIFCTYLTTIGITNGLGVWFLPFASGLLLIPISIFICQLLKKQIA